MSINGYGGAVASSSSSQISGEVREIKNCVFSGNKALQSVGLDIVDSSSYGINYYSKTTVINSVSSSNSTQSGYSLFAVLRVYLFFF
jgi:ABC-type branched-subunit amino acid transport system ATPase component